MEHKLITTFKEYKETYQTRLENHLAIYDDFDELHFINSELDNYKICLRASNIKTSTIFGANGNRFLDKTIYSPDFVNSNNDTAPPDTGLVWQVYKLIRDEKFNLTGGYDIEKSKRLNLSFTKIIEFLKEKEFHFDKINEYKSKFMQPDLTIIAMLDGIETPKVDNDKIRQSEKYIYLKETAKEYAEKYNTRLTEFLNEFEADEIDFIEKDDEYFENTLYDVQNSESSHDGYSTTGFDNFSTAYQLAIDIGFDKFMYSTKAKLTFLANQKNIVLPREQKEPELINAIETNESDVKETKSLLFNGKKLNYAERFTIANQVFGVAEKFRTLNISDNDKNQILSYVLGCNIDNARHLINGTYKAKERKSELLAYLTALNLNK